MNGQQKEFNLPEQYAEILKQILGALAEWQRIREGRLRQIYIPKPRINLTSQDARPVNSAPYCVGPKTCKLEKTEFDKMLRMKVIDSASQNGHRRSYSPRRMTVPYASLLNREGLSPRSLRTHIRYRKRANLSTN